MDIFNWEEILGRAGAAFNLGIDKKEQLMKSRMAKFIAAIPYLAGCNKPLQTSIAHLSIYILSLDESTKDVFFHMEEDDSDLYLRLFPISSFSGGDESVLKCCMDLIALCMLENYKKDMIKDKDIGKYNPLVSGAWEYDIKSKQLNETIDSLITPEISSYYTKEDSLAAYWRD